MKPPPKGWPRLSAGLCYDDAAAACDWLCRAFGFELRMKVEADAGRIAYAELTYGEALVMISSLDPSRETHARFASPQQLGGKTTVSLCVVVDDVDAHCAHARAAGAEVVAEPETKDYGEEYWADRSYQARDLEGHVWWFLQRIRDEPG